MRRRSRTIIPMVIPASKLVKLRYCTYLELDPAAAAQGVRNIFRANGCYDPDQSGIGHQPLGFDQWSAFYDQYVVLGSKCTARFMANSESVNFNSGLVGIWLTDGQGSIPAIETLMEQPGIVSKMLTNAYGSRGAVVCKKNFSAKKFFGVRDVKDNRDDLGANVTADPSSQAWYSVYFHSINAYNPTSITVQVTIDYIVHFSERKNVIGS